MTLLIRFFVPGLLLLVVACTESSGASLDSSVGTAVAETVSAQGTPTQLPGVALGPPATSIFCPGCKLVDVTGIVDGDTIDTSIGRVRFFGVDTPELGDRCFTEATEFTRLLVGDQVRLEDGPRLRDQFGRRLAYIYDASGNSLDVQLIAAGYAKAWTRDGQHRDMFVGLEANARSNQVGCLWGAIVKSAATALTQNATGPPSPVSTATQVFRGPPAARLGSDQWWEYVATPAEFLQNSDADRSSRDEHMALMYAAAFVLRSWLDGIDPWEQDFGEFVRSTPFSELPQLALRGLGEAFGLDEYEPWARPYNDPISIAEFTLGLYASWTACLVGQTWDQCELATEEAMIAALDAFD